MSTAPFPEEITDFRNIATARNVFNRLVVDGDYGCANERFTSVVGQLDLNGGIFARFIRLRGRGYRDVNNSFLRWNDNFLCFLEYPTIGNCYRFDKEVGHIFLDDGDFNDGTFTIKPNQLRW